MYQTIAEISLEKILRNARELKKRAGVPLIAVVKDDGYGHGAERVALALDSEASAFAVASSTEGESLRVAGVDKDILVLSPALSEEEILRMASFRLTLSLTSKEAVALALATAEKYSLSLNAQLAVNTGMNRYGVPISHIEGILTQIQGKITLIGVFSHLYMADNRAVREEQRKLFLRACERVLRVYPDAVRHLSATGGALCGKEFAFDAVRCGIALYGYLPEGFAGAIPVKPAMRVYAPVSQNGRFYGEGAGYQRAKAERGYTLRFGYGDGFFRAGGMGIGKLCMDACVCEGDARFGEYKLILTNAEEYAKLHGTSAYEALTGIGQRAVKVYI